MRRSDDGDLAPDSDDHRDDARPRVPGVRALTLSFATWFRVLCFQISSNSILASPRDVFYDELRPGVDRIRLFCDFGIFSGGTVSSYPPRKKPAILRSRYDLLRGRLLGGIHLSRGAKLHILLAGRLYGDTSYNRRTPGLFSGRLYPINRIRASTERPRFIMVCGTFVYNKGFHASRR